MIITHLLILPLLWAGDETDLYNLQSDPLKKAEEFFNFLQQSTLKSPCISQDAFQFSSDFPLEGPEQNCSFSKLCQPLTIGKKGFETYRSSDGGKIYDKIWIHGTNLVAQCHRKKLKEKLFGKDPPVKKPDNLGKILQKWASQPEFPEILSLLEALHAPASKEWREDL